MSILVTGGAGYIGSHMVLALLAKGEKVVVLDNLSTGRKEAVPAHVPLVEADLGDMESTAALLRLHRIETVIHFGARLVVSESVADPLGYYLGNTVKTRALLAACHAVGVKHFIFSSTAAVYGIVGNEPVGENHSTLPVSPYGSSKLMSEWMLRDLALASSLRHVTLRYFNVAGCDPAGRAGPRMPGATHLIKVALEAAMKQRSHVDIFGQDYATPDGTGLRDYIHVTDLIAAHVGAMDYLRQGGASLTMNAGYGHGYSVREVIDMVRHVVGSDFEVRQSPRRPGDLASVIADSRLIRQTLGWKPQWDDLRTIIQHAYDWERKKV